MNHISEELGIPKKYLTTTVRDDKFIANVHRIWIKNLLKQSKLTEFIEKPANEDIDGQSWLNIFIRVLKKRESKVLPLPKIKNAQKSKSNPLLFPLFLQYISQTNYKNLWKEAYKKYCNNNNDNVKDIQVILADHNDVLREVIIRTYGCAIINICDVSNTLESSNNYDAHLNVYPTVCAVETMHAFFLLHIPQIKHNLNDCVTFSPSVLDKCYTKPLFIVYQLLQLLNSLHNSHMTLGDINLNDIYVTDDLWLYVFPQLNSNIYLQDVPNKLDIIKTNLNNYDCRKLGHKFDVNIMKCQCCGMRTYDKVQVSKNDNLEKLCNLWINGQISNFTYITALNRFSGRKHGDPNCHHVFPWVTDFTSRCGKVWRNLNKSKYRLNKGDRQLDLTYEDIQSHQIPHHVSDVLSSITYYVYVARRTPKSILCKYVRSTWVPGEYPSSIQRLQEWTPDECIPEFFTDPTTFKSTHEDMDDLEVPSWSSSPEDFIERHREILESNHVSERLHHWIDLTFGYKLSGNAAIKSKNVCLHLVDEHTNLTNSGIVQLFRHPHPPRIVASPYWGKSPPHIYVRKHRERDHSTSSSSIQMETSKSEDDDIGFEFDTALASSSSSSNKSPLTLSRFLSRSRSSLNEEKEQKPSRSPSAQRSISLGPKNPSFQSHIPNANNKTSGDFISLPKDYNPAQALISLENRHNFYMKTFHKQESKFSTSNTTNNNATENASLNNDESDLLQYDDTGQNSFTNRIFAETFEGRISKRATKSYTFPMDHNTIPLRNNNARIKLNKNENQIVCNYSEIITERKIKELQILGCIIVEIFLNKQIRTLGNNTINLTFKQRLEFCTKIINCCSNEVPPCIRYLINLLLQPNNDFNYENFQYPNVSDLGLPPPSAHLLLEPLISIVPFPPLFYELYGLISNLKDYEITTNELNLLYYFECNGQKCLEYEALEKTKILLMQNVAECKVKSCVKFLEKLIDKLNPYTDNYIVDLLVPNIKKLIEDIPTSVLAAWYLFDPISRLLGQEKSCEILLDSMLKLYENDFNESNLPYLNKIAKLYHHSFHLRLIVRFGLKCFLEHFVTPLVEAVGGYRDYDKMDNFLHTHSEKNIRKTSNLKNITDETNDYSPDDSSSSEKNSVTAKKQPEIINETTTATTTTNAEPEMFDFDNEETQEPLESLIEHLELNINNDLPFNHSVAEEALEATVIDSNVDRSNNLEELNLNVSEDEDVNYSKPLMSPTIPIPNKKNKDLVEISCDVGSKNSDFEITDRKIESVNEASSSSINNQSNQFSNLMKTNKYDAKISDMSAESLNWLSHRLGPVLTAKYLSRNLLKMLTLCYVGKENLLPLTDNGDNNGLNELSVTGSHVIGDRNATKVLECLSNIAALYGEQIILLQYIPHIAELVTLCKKRLSPNLEGSLISCLSLLKHIIPYISDATLVLQLEDILKTIIHPCVRLLGSTKFTFPNGPLARKVLSKKYLDTLYILSLRMGAEMSRTHLAVPALQRFFLIFEKINQKIHVAAPLNDEKLVKSIEDSNSNHFQLQNATDSLSGKPLPITQVRLKHADSIESLSPTPPQELQIKDDSIANQAIEELRSVFTPELAHMAYLPFLKHMGQNALQISLKNHDTILKLCQEYEQEMRMTNTNISPHLKLDNQNSCVIMQGATSSSIGSNIALIGNRIDVQEVSSDKVSVLNLISDKMENTSRHLRGNWLAYWEHEIGRSEKDNRFNFKQIKLQTFNGHTHSIKALHVLDNENSFISGSRDKTIKLWSLRSQGDGSNISCCQWTYTEHKKSILALTFIESLRLVASCDSIIRIWDPFMMRDIKSMESTKHPPVNCLKTMPSPSALLFAATTEGTVKVIDARIFTYVHELRVNINQSCLIRCLAVPNSGHWLAAGQSSGYITVLDTRTGLIKSTWRAHESEVLQLVAYGENKLISSSLDQTISVWNVHDGHFIHYMNLYLPRGASEPVHCLNLYNNELISGTTANRIGVHTSVNFEASFYSIKLRQDAFKGLLTSMTILPLNRLLLLGADSGNISLLC